MKIQTKNFIKKMILPILFAALASSNLPLAQAQNRLEVRGDRLEETESQSADCRLEDRLEATNQVTGCRLQDKNRLKATNQVIGCRLQVAGTNQTTNYELENRLEEAENKPADCRLQKVEGDVINEGEYNNQELFLEKDATPIFHLLSSISQPYFPSSISYLGVTPKLMMDPKAVEEGIEDVKGVFRSSGKTASSSKTAVTTTTATGSPIGNSSSSAAITGQRGLDAVVALTTEESEEGTDVSKFLEDEICNNIYMNCLAKVTTMSLAERKTAEGISQEAKEWAAAEKKAMRDVAKREGALQDAKEETQQAEKRLNATLPHLHGEDIYTTVHNDYKIKTLTQSLAKTKVKTARATLFAIEVKDTAQSAGAVADIKEAIEEEKNAYDVLDAATAKISKTSLSAFSSSGKQNQTTPSISGMSPFEEEGADVPNTINLPASQSPVLFTSPKSPMSGHETAAISHSFVNPSIPIVEAVAIPSGNNLTGSDFLHQPKLSEERVIKKKIEAEAEAEKEELEKFLEQIYIGEAKVAEEKIVLENKNTQLLEETTEAENITKEEDNTKVPEVAETKEPSYEKEQSQIKKTVQAVVGRRNIWVGAAGAAIVGYTVLCRTAWAEILGRVTNPCSYKSNEDINCIWMNKNLIANNAWNEANKNDQFASTAWYQAISNKAFTDYINTSSFSTAENFWNKAIATHQEALSVAPEVNKETLKKNIKEAQSKKDFWTKRISWTEAIEVAEMKLEKARNEENTHYGTVNEIYANQAGEFYVEVQSISNKSIKTDLACECINLLSNSLSDSDKIFQANQDYIFNRFKDAEHTFNEIVESFKVDSSNKDETNKTITFWIDKKDYFAKKFAQFQNISKRLEDTIAKREEDLIVSKNSVIREMPSTEILIRQKAEDQTKKENWILLSKEAHEKAAIAKTANKKDEGDSWSDAENNFDNAAQTLSKAIKAELKGESEVARKYREAAEQQVLSAEYYTQSAEAYALGKKEEGSDWNKAGYGLWYELINLDIAIQKEKLNPEEVRQYREVAEQYKCSVDPFAQAARAYAAKKINEVAGNWDNAAFGFYNAAGTLEKVIIAESSNEAEKAQKLRKAAKQYTCSGKVHIESARAYEQGKTNEGKSWYMAGNAFHNEANKLKNTIEVKTAEKLKEAQKWKEAAGFFIQAARAYAEEKKDEGDRWRNAGNGCYYAAVKLGKAIDADVAGKFAIAQKWREAAEQQVSSVDSFTKAVTAYAEGKIKEAASWNNAGFDFYWAGEKLEGAIESEASEEITEAQTLREQAEEHQKKALATQAQAKAQHIIAMKKEEGEAAFAEARKEKTVTEWNKAKVAAEKISNYWDEVVKSIQIGRSSLALSQEEATFQREYWTEKTGVAEIKALEATDCGSGWEEKRNRTDAMMTMIKNKIWPTVSHAMQGFIKHPSEAGMLDIREAAIAYASASASAYSPAFASAYAYAYDYASASASASASAYAYTSVSVFVSAFDYASAYAYASTSVSAFASASAYTSAYAPTSAFAFASASAFASAYSPAFASALASASASEALQIASVVDDLVDNTKVFENLLGKYFTETGKQNRDWSISAARETAEFARAVATYKEPGYREGSRLQVTGDRGQAVIEAARKAFTAAKTLKTEDAWKKAGVAAKEAVIMCQNNQVAQGMSREEAAQQRDYWTEQANLAVVKILATSHCDDNRGEQLERANAIMKITREKFGSPISPSMKEFMLHPNEATLKATGKSALIAMSAAEAEESLEGAEVFKKACTDAAALKKMDGWDASFQESINLSVSVANEVAEFARAVVLFKKEQEKGK